MRYETVTHRAGEWLGDVPEDWNYDEFCDKFLSADRKIYEESIQLFKEMSAAIKQGKKVIATESGQFSHEVLSCGLYDGWPFWVPRPCYSYKGPIPGEHIAEFYDLTSIRIKQ
jgi:hypothetical protein